MHQDGSNRAILIQIIAASAIGVAAAAGARHYLQRRNHQNHSIEAEPMAITPKLFDATESAHGDTLEGFPHYVARQIGFPDPSECPQLCKLAYDYLRKTDRCEERIYDFVANEADADAVYMKLIEEFDRCILGYFAHNWNRATTMITQVLRFQSDKPKENSKALSWQPPMTRVFSTLVEEIKAIGTTSSEEDRDRENVMMPVKLSERSPVLLFMGGGMGVGKSTVLKDILKEAISSKGHHDDMLQTAELVHQSSTDAASSLLVTALNEGRDVIMDGTLSWEPFVEQTIAMARNVHRCRYSMGVGYKRKPYRIEMVGVVCDAYLAVIRGIRRAILMGRAVRVKSQLTSHKRFANAFRSTVTWLIMLGYIARIPWGTPLRVERWSNNLLVDQEEIKCLKKVSMLNEDADSIHDLYQQQSEPTPKASSDWHEIVISPSRATIQQELKTVIAKVKSRIRCQVRNLFYHFFSFLLS
ncbi:hypothetical protein MKW92_021524 [Papaver armeniacum]|nr:hypothetical protein MKW92_021524 [Papaver armeniacum]